MQSNVFVLCRKVNKAHAETFELNGILHLNQYVGFLHFSPLTNIF